MSRFDYVKYDDTAMDSQAILKNKFVELESLIESKVTSPRPKALAMTKLEECYMWVGKAIRDDQLVRDNVTERRKELSNS